MATASVPARVAAAIKQLQAEAMPITLRRICEAAKRIDPAVPPLAETSILRQPAAYALYVRERTWRSRARYRRSPYLAVFPPAQQDRANKLLRHCKSRLVSTVLALEAEIAVLRRELLLRGSPPALALARVPVCEDVEFTKHHELLRLAESHRALFRLEIGGGGHGQPPDDNC